MENTNTNIVKIGSEADLRIVLKNQYMKQIENYFGDQHRALEFLSGVVAAVQRNPKLLECTPETLLNSFIVMASLKLMPSGVSGEAFVLPYKNRDTMEAQFQLGYQGLVTLLYRAGARSIVAEIVRRNDSFKVVSGEVLHEPDVFADDRGDAIGAYVIVELQTGAKISKVMSKKEIMGIGEKFSKSYKSDFSPWKSNDPELWMWKKTVLKQAAKLMPKNETIYRAIAEDNKDSNVTERTTSVVELPASEIDPAQMTQYEAWLNDCKTKAQLEKVWADIPAVYRARLTKTIEEVKAIILDSSNADA